MSQVRRIVPSVSHLFLSRSPQCLSSYPDSFSHPSLEAQFPLKSIPMQSTSNVPNPRRLVHLQLLLPFSQQELDRAEVFLVQGYVASEFPPREGLEVGPVRCGFEAGGAEAAAVEGEDVALEAG
jgi:hypothetical protein